MKLKEIKKLAKKLGDENDVELHVKHNTTYHEEITTVSYKFRYRGNKYGQFAVFKSNHQEPYIETTILKLIDNYYKSRRKLEQCPWLFWGVTNGKS